MIYHIALEKDWESALEAGEYRISTLGRTLEEEGFLHASYGNQVRTMADRFYADVSEPLVLLTIDERRLTVPLQVDAVGPEGEADAYPHVYGALDVAAVVMATPLLRDGQGRLELPDLP
ncbi:MAG TPA: DUF952 domain-containing protein [Kineosporiaceae bacterium]|nr:DUF952 domain-containing protein [Kineosporiaceae bacterium]